MPGVSQTQPGILGLLHILVLAFIVYQATPRDPLVLAGDEQARFTEFGIRVALGATHWFWQ